MGLRKPQILILDDFSDCFEEHEIPALITALRKYQGGVVVMSSNEMFCDTIATEKWHVHNGSLRVEAISSDKSDKAAELMKREIIEIEKRLNEAKIHGLTDEEAWELFDKTNELKEMLVQDVKLQDPVDVDEDDDDLDNVTGLGQ